MQKRLEVSDWRSDEWTAWPVYWTAVWVGTLTTLAVALIFGLAATALGAQLLGPWPDEVANWSEIGLGALIVAVFGAFLSFVAGGWVAVQIAGIRRPETSMLHGAIVWLVTLPLLMGLVALGAGGLLGGWYGGLAGTPSWVQTTDEELPANATEDQKAAVRAEQERAARVTRNSALGAITALLLGLVGSVLGGWMASGEPMRFNFNRPPRGEHDADVEEKSGRRKVKA